MVWIFLLRKKTYRGIPFIQVESSLLRWLVSRVYPEPAEGNQSRSPVAEINLKMDSRFRGNPVFSLIFEDGYPIKQLGYDRIPLF